MIGARCGIYTPEEGRIECSGRMIVNDDVMLFSKGHLEIGHNLGINQFSRIVAHEKIQIGKNVTIGQMVAILDHDHAYHLEDGNLNLKGYKTKPIKIGDNVWIGDKAMILKGVEVGDNVVIGAHTLINKDVPEGSIVAGNPFKVIKKIS